MWSGRQKIAIFAGKSSSMADKKIFGLIGFPLTHSFSQNYFNQKFESEGIDAEYINFEIADIGDLMKVLAAYPELGGLNVTIPYKEQVIPYMDEMDSLAEEVGAVNVIKILTGKEDNDLWLKGFNSDVIGFRDSIEPLLTPQRTKALILGTGGASKAVKVALRQLGVESTPVSRNPGPGQLGYGDLTRSVMDEHKIIVNTTPLGMYPHTDECPDIPYQFLDEESLCYDLLYNPDVTLFMQNALEHGAEVKNGLEMLLLQAFASWTIWNS